MKNSLSPLRIPPLKNHHTYPTPARKILLPKKKISVYFLKPTTYVYNGKSLKHAAPAPGAVGGQVIPRDIVIRLLTMQNKMNITKFGSDDFGQKGTLEGARDPPIFWSIKKCTTAFNYRSNEPSSDLLGSLVRYDHPWKKRRKNK